MIEFIISTFISLISINTLLTSLFLLFNVKLMCLIVIITRFNIFIITITKVLKKVFDFNGNLDLKTFASISRVPLKMAIESLFQCVFVTIALYFINDSIVYVYDWVENSIEKYYNNNQNLLINFINLFKYQENSLNNPSESVTILEKGISDIKFDKVNLQDQTSEDTENYLNLVEKKSNVYIDSIALIWTASLICVVAISYYLIP